MDSNIGCACGLPNIYGLYSDPWSSSERNDEEAYASIGFVGGGTSYSLKSNLIAVRAVRTF